MDLGVALCAVGKQRLPGDRIRRTVGIQRAATHIGEVVMHEMAPHTLGRETLGRVNGVSRVASQAEKGRRLVQHLVGHRAVRIVAVRAVLGRRWMFIRKRPLFLGMTLEADSVDRLRLEVSLVLSMRLMARGTGHLAFVDRVR